MEKDLEYKGPPIHVQVLTPVVQPVVQHTNQGYLPRMSLAYPGASTSPAVVISTPILGHPISHLEFIMVILLIRQSILAWCILLKRFDQWIFLWFILHCKYLWCLFHATHFHLMLRPSTNSLLRLKFWKINKLCHVIIKDGGKPDIVTRIVFSMTRSLYHLLNYCHISSSKGQSCQKIFRLLHSHIMQSTILMPHVLIRLGIKGILLRIDGFSKLGYESLLIRRFCHSFRRDPMS